MKTLESTPPHWGKHWGLRRLADADGHFTMVAIDQRPPIIQRIAQARGIAPADVAFADVVQVKGLLAEALAPHASAMLVDPDWGLPAATPHLRPDRGLLLTLEDHRYADGPDGRRSHAIANWSVAQIRRLGADAVKLLAWYRPDAGAAVRAHQQAFVRAVGEDCRRHDVPFVFELLVHPFASAAPVNYDEDGAKLARHVIDSVHDFADEACGVDLFKLESPWPMSALPDPDGPGAAAAQAVFDAMGVACRGTPWVMLSAGAGPEAFGRAVTFAGRAGASGFLAGRAVWAEALQAWPDVEATRRRLRDDAVPVLQRLAERVKRVATPMTPRVRFDSIHAEGDLCRARTEGVSP